MLPTPFLADDELDRASFVRVVHHVLSLGVKAVMFPGFGSEYFALDDAERRLLLSELCRHARGEAAVVASVPDQATPLAVAAHVNT